MTPRTQLMVRLSERDLNLIQDVARFKLLTSHQIKRRYFPDATHKAAAGRLARLTNDPATDDYLYLTRTYALPKSSPHPTGHPTAHYFWTPTNQKRLRAHLESRGWASLWDEHFAALTALNNHDGTFDPQYLAHEIDISEYFLCLEEDAPRHGWEVIFWERTSPFSEELRDASRLPYGKITVTMAKRQKDGRTTRVDEHVSFNPDAFYCLRSPDDLYYLLFHEEDNNTSTALRFRTKLMGYHAYAKQGYWPHCLSYYITKYRLPPDRVSKGFRVTTATPDTRRRNKLFLASLPLKSYKRFLFGSMTDLSPTTALSPLWIRGKEFTDIRDRLHAIPLETAPHLYEDKLVDLLADMPRVSLID